MYSLKRIVAFIVFLCATNFMISQTTYNRRLDVAHKADYAGFLYLKSDTFFIPTYVIETQSPLKYSTCLMSVKANGSILSQKRFRRVNTSLEPCNCLLNRNNKFYFTGSASRGTDIREPFYTFSEQCDSLTVKLYGDTSYYFTGYDIKKSSLSQNKLLIFGVTDSTCGTGHPGKYKPFIRVVDTLGNILSTKMYMNTCLYRTLTNADTARNKGYVFCGFELRNSLGYGAVYVIKLDSNLNTVWQKYYDTLASVYPSIATLKSGKFILAYGEVDSIGIANDLWARIGLIKMDENGNVLWHKQYGSMQTHNTATHVIELPNKDFLLCGVMDVPTGNSTYPTQLKGFLLRTDSLGNKRWLNTYKATYPNDITGENYLYHMVPMSDGGFAAVGFVGPGDTSTQDTWLLRVDSMGCLTPGCNNNTGINNTHANVSKILAAYPDPFSDELNVTTFLLGIESEAKIQLIEPSTGKVLIEKIVGTGEQRTVLNTQELSQGLYLIGISGINISPGFIKVVHLKQ